MILRKLTSYLEIRGPDASWIKGAGEIEILITKDFIERYFVLPRVREGLNRMKTVVPFFFRYQ